MTDQNSRRHGDRQRGPGELHYQPEVDIKDKGLSHDAIGLAGSVVVAISTVAPVYTLTGALGPTVREVGVHLPAIFLIGFVPMLLVAFAYRELNKVRTRGRRSPGPSRPSGRASAGCAGGAW